MKTLKLFVVLFALLSLIGCDSGDSGDGSNNSNQYNSININELDYGFSIVGVSSDYESVRLIYCSTGNYEYYRGNSSFYGSFNIVGDEVQMYDNDGGSYVIVTYGTNSLDVGETYAIRGLSSDITVSEINEISCYIE